MWIAILALALSQPAPAPASPECACVVSELGGPCGYEREQCRCSDGHGWSSYWLLDAASGTCEEYRMVLPLEESGD